MSKEEKWRTRESLARCVPLEPDEEPLYWTSLTNAHNQRLREVVITNRRIICLSYELEGLLRPRIVDILRAEIIIPLGDIRKYWQEKPWLVDDIYSIYIETKDDRLSFYTREGKDKSERFLSETARAISTFKKKEKQERIEEKRLEIYEYRYSFADVKVDPQMGTLLIGCPFCHAPKPEKSTGNEIKCRHCGKTYLIPPGLQRPQTSTRDSHVRSCKKCGSPVDPDSTYCSQCGSVLE